jgi:hypothetical protein
MQEDAAADPAKAAAPPSVLGYSSATLSPGTTSAIFHMTHQEADPVEDATGNQAPPGPSARETFLSWMAMGPEERYVTMILARKGYTREEFQALPADEQEKIMREVREEIRRKTEEEAAEGQSAEAPSMTISAPATAPEAARASSGEMADWITDRTRSGNLPLDQGFPIAEMAAQTTAEGREMLRQDDRRRLDLSI